MPLIVNKILPTILSCIILFSLTGNSVTASEFYNLSDTPDGSKGYSDIVLFRNSFFAFGTDGRIDCISRSGDKAPIEHSNKSKLNCAFSNDEILLAAGDHGTIMYSIDGKGFYQVESGTDKNINGIASKNGLIITCADGGLILASKDGKSWNIIRTETKGNIISLTANNSFFIGITDEGEIIKSFDGVRWEIKDYNKEYAGYNKYAKFKKILAAQNSIVIIGTHDDNSPSILFSSLGNVWAERIPFYIDDKGMDCLVKEPNDITYNSEYDEFILACDDGELLCLPACNKCNEYMKVSENDLNAVLYADNSLIVVGEGFSVFIQNGN